MKKLSVVFIIALLLLLTPTAFAESEYSRLQDTAMLLSESEQSEILAYLDEVSERHGMDVVIFTADVFLEGTTPEEDATELYEYLGYGVDGAMLYVNMADRDWYFLTSGFCITAINDAGIEFISDDFVYWLSDGDYAEAFRVFIRRTDEFITQAKTGEPYTADTMPYGEFPYIFFAVVVFVIGLIIAAIITGVWKMQLHTVAMQNGATNYVKGGINMERSQDLFLYKTVSRVARETSSSSGSTTHRSSSGRTYGGGGGKF